MKKTINLFLFFALISVLISCGKDDDNATTCDGVLNNGGTIEFDGEALNLSVAQLLISSGFDGDIYQFQVGGLTNDCNELKTLSFFAEITTNSNIDGTYDILDFFDASLNDVTGVNTTNTNISSGQQSLVEIKSGTMVVKKLADREYEVDMTGALTGGGSIEVNFKSEF